MIENTGNNEFDQNGAEANVPFDREQTSTMGISVPMDKLKDYGKKAYAPLIKVVHRYQDEIVPYLTALSRGLQGGVDALSSESGSETDKYVAGWFKEASEGINEAVTKLQSNDIGQVVSFIEAQAQKRPSFMFTSSYLTGLFFGRISRHIGRKTFSHRSANMSDVNTNSNFDNKFTNDFNLGDQSMH